MIELTPMLFVPDVDPADKPRWISLHPVYVWQFEAFLAVVDWHLIQNYFMKVTDLMQPVRVQSQRTSAYVTQVYHEEAVAYAHWFGKYLARWFDLRPAKAYLADDFDRILPPGLSVWDEVQYGDSEFTRVAIGAEDVELDPDEVDDPPESMNYEEWAAPAHVSLVTALLTGKGLLDTLPRKAYEFIELKNAAIRP